MSEEKKATRRGFVKMATTGLLVTATGCGWAGRQVGAAGAGLLGGAKDFANGVSTGFGGSEEEEKKKKKEK